MAVPVAPVLEEKLGFDPDHKEEISAASELSEKENPAPPIPSPEHQLTKLVMLIFGALNSPRPTDYSEIFSEAVKKSGTQKITFPLWSIISSGDKEKFVDSIPESWATIKSNISGDNAFDYLSSKKFEKDLETLDSSLNPPVLKRMGSILATLFYRIYNAIVGLLRPDWKIQIPVVAENPVLLKDLIELNKILKANTNAVRWEAQYHHAQSESQSMKDQLARQDKKISTLETQVAALQAQINDLQKQAGDLQAQINDLQKQVGDLQAQINDLQAQTTTHSDKIAQKDDQIATLKNQLTDLQAEKTKYSFSIFRRPFAFKSSGLKDREEEVEASVLEA